MNQVKVGQYGFAMPSRLISGKMKTNTIGAKKIIVAVLLSAAMFMAAFAIARKASAPGRESDPASNRTVQPVDGSNNNAAVGNVPQEPESPGGLSVQAAESGGYWHPAQFSSWQIQFNGTLDTSVNADVFDVDLFDTSQSVIDQLHQQGRKVICYFSAGSFEDWRPDAGDFPESVLGNNMGDWPGERWLDIRNINALAPIMRARLHLAVTKKCDGIDTDNVDSYTNDTGFPLSASNQLAYNRFIAQEAHARNLAIGLKNDLDQIPALVGNFDFAINEQCLQYDECGAYDPFVQAKKPVFHIEYSGSQSSICKNPARKNFNTIKKRTSLNAWRLPC